MQPQLFSPLRLSSSLQHHLEVWKRCAGRLAHVGPSRRHQTLNAYPWSLPEALGPSPSCALPVSGVLVSTLPLARVVFEACDCFRTHPFLRVPYHAWLVARSAQLRPCLVVISGRRGHSRSAVHCGDALWAHRASLSRGACSACRAFAASLPLAFSPFPKAAPVRSRGSVLLSQRGPTVKSCPAAPPDRSVSTAAQALRPLLLALLSLETRQAWPASPPCPSFALRLLIQLRLLPFRLVDVAPQAPLWHGIANGISTAVEIDATLNFRCGVRLSVKFSPALQCGPAAPTPRLMTMSTTLATHCCCCLPMPAPRALLSHLSELEELMVALSCRFALDIFTVAQQYQPPAPDLPAHDPGHDFCPGQALSRQHGWTCIIVAFLLLHACLLKVPFNLNDPGSLMLGRFFSARLVGPKPSTLAHVRCHPSDTRCALSWLMLSHSFLVVT